MLYTATHLFTLEKQLIRFQLTMEKQNKLENNGDL